MADSTDSSKKKFEPKQPVELAPPKDDVISLEYLNKSNGKNKGYPTLVAIKGTVFDVSAKGAYAPGKSYNVIAPVFAGKHPNSALGRSSLKEEDCNQSDYSSLTESEKKVLEDWYTFFSKRYNIVGRLETDGSSNL